MTTTLRHSYTPHGACLEAFKSRAPEVLLAGPAGTGKSRACLEKVHAMCLLNPGMRALLVRKTQTSLTSTGLVTWRRDVVPEALTSGAVSYYGGSAEEPAQYRYDNGSKVILGGLDKATKIMSSEYDIIYVQEATELTEDDWEALTTRLRSGVVSFQQLLADANPDTPTHWLKRRCDNAQTLLLESRHEDNPILYSDGAPTDFGHTYLARLDNLTGVRYHRLRLGHWVAAEGMIYEEWDAPTHIHTCTVDPSWTRYWAVDFGYTNPFVLQCYAVDPDDRLHLYREIYHTQRTVDEHARTILNLVAPDGTWTEPRPRTIICDHDAEGRATLSRAVGVNTTGADKRVLEGIQEVQRRLRPRGDGTPGVYIHADALVATDPELALSNQPTSTAAEIPGYIWKDHQHREEPVKENDHGCDALRYMAMHLVRPTPKVRWL